LSRSPSIVPEPTAAHVRRRRCGRWPGESQRYDGIFANRDYAVLKREFTYLGIGSPGARAAAMFEIGRPDLDWTLLAKGMGVPGIRVNSLDAFGKALRAGLEGSRR